MLCQDTNGETPAVHVDKETLKLALRVQQFAEVIQHDQEGGNGEIIIKLKVAGGKIRSLLNFSGHWLPGKQK
jgi:hypothetical protein